MIGEVEAGGNSEPEEGSWEGVSGVCVCVCVCLCVCVYVCPLTASSSNSQT